MNIYIFICAYSRIIVGAPHGTYPGGVPGLPTLMPENGTGLVYQCPLRNGNCTGVMGNDRLNDRRLFDGDRKYCIIVIYKPSPISA